MTGSHEKFLVIAVGKYSHTWEEELNVLLMKKYLLCVKSTIIFSNVGKTGTRNLTSKIKTIAKEKEHSSSCITDEESAYKLKPVSSVKKGKGQRSVTRIPIKDQKIDILIDICECHG